MKLKNLTDFEISYNPLERIEITSDFLKNLEVFLVDRTQISILKKNLLILKKSYLKFPILI